MSPEISYITLTQGKTAKVDTRFFAALAKYKRHARKSSTAGKFYAVSSVYSGGKTRKILMHRKVLELAGVAIRGEPDHKDRDGLNNLVDNLRESTHAENQRNRGANSNSKSGLKGVHFCKTRRKWRARIMTNGRYKFLGYFETAELGAEAYNTAAIADHGKFAYLNSLPETELQPQAAQ